VKKLEGLQETDVDKEPGSSRKTTTKVPNMTVQQCYAGQMCDIITL
jgi:hypothetical protein